MFELVVISVFVVLPVCLAYRSGSPLPILIPAVLFVIGATGMDSGSTNAVPDETDVIPKAFLVLGAVGVLASLLAGSAGARRRS